MTDDAAPAAGGGGGKTVKLPVIGPTKRVYVYVGAGVVAVVVGYAYWKRSQGGAGGAGDATYVPDPATGSDTGSDAYAGANDSKSGTAGSTYYDNLPASPSTDQQWTAAVVGQLSYLEPDYVYGVIGKYLGRQPLSLDEAAVVRSAWAAVGHPPGGQQIITATDTSTPGTSRAPGTPTGLSISSVTANAVRFGWAAVAGATTYTVTRSDGQSTTAHGAGFSSGGLKPGTVYSYTVTAVNGYGTSAPSAALTFTTPAGSSRPAPTTGPGSAPKPTTPAPSGSAAHPSVARPIVRRGATGSDVRTIQQIVGAKVDGQFGPETEARVKAWQKAHGLKADGIVGPLTQAKMGI